MCVQVTERCKIAEGQVEGLKIKLLDLEGILSNKKIELTFLSEQLAEVPFSLFVCAGHCTVSLYCTCIVSIVPQSSFYGCLDLLLLLTGLKVKKLLMVFSTCMCDMQVRIVCICCKFIKPSHPHILTPSHLHIFTPTHPHILTPTQKSVSQDLERSQTQRLHSKVEELSSKLAERAELSRQVDKLGQENEDMRKAFQKLLQ